MPRLVGLLSEWGIKCHGSVVVDLSGQHERPTAPVAAPPYPTHAITDHFRLITAFPLVRAFSPRPPPQKPTRRSRSSRPAPAAGPRRRSRR